MYLVRRGYFWSFDKVGSHTSWSAVAKNPMQHADFTALSSIELDVLSIKVLHCGNKDFLAFLLLWPWAWPDDLHVRTDRYPLKMYPQTVMNFLCQAFRHLSLLHTHRHTYSHRNYYDTTLQMVLVMVLVMMNVVTGWQWSESAFCIFRRGCSCSSCHFITAQVHIIISYHRICYGADPPELNSALHT